MPTRLKSSIPNALTLSRLLLSCALFGILEFATRTGLPASALNLACALFILAAATDALDGLLARRWQVVSRFGRVMDPFCDKLLVLGSLFYFAGPGFVVAGVNVTGFSVWMILLIFARELLVTTMRGLIESGGNSFAAASSGKAKMVLQSLAIPVILLLLANAGLVHPDSAPRWANLTRDFLVWSTTTVTLLSGLPYLFAFASAPDPSAR